MLLVEIIKIYLTAGIFMNNKANPERKPYAVLGYALSNGYNGRVNNE
jgi:hypothetical protein